MALAFGNPTSDAMVVVVVLVLAAVFCFLFCSFSVVSCYLLPLPEILDELIIDGCVLFMLYFSCPFVSLYFHFSKCKLDCYFCNLLRGTGSEGCFQQITLFLIAFSTSTPVFNLPSSSSLVDLLCVSIFLVTSLSFLMKDKILLAVPQYVMIQV